MTGMTISHYRIEEELGGDGIGALYKAEDRGIDDEMQIGLLDQIKCDPARVLQGIARVPSTSRSQGETDSPSEIE